MKKILVILLPLLAVGWYLGLGGCLLTMGRNEMRSGSVNDYMESDVSHWIAIPPSATNITTYRFLAFDTNHRYLMATIQPESTDLAELCSRSMDLQDLKTNNSLTILTNINLSNFNAVFGGAPKSTPSWWNTDETQYDQRYLCAWENTNHYGYGYLFLMDSKKGKLQAFQWIQQWNTVSNTTKAFEIEGVEQAGAGYPPQGVGSPDP